MTLVTQSKGTRWVLWVLAKDYAQVLSLVLIVSGLSLDTKQMLNKHEVKLKHPYLSLRDSNVCCCCSKSMAPLVLNIFSLMMCQKLTSRCLPSLSTHCLSKGDTINITHELLKLLCQNPNGRPCRLPNPTSPAQHKFHSTDFCWLEAGWRMCRRHCLDQLSKLMLPLLYSTCLCQAANVHFDNVATIAQRRPERLLLSQSCSAPRRKV